MKQLYVLVIYDEVVSATENIFETVKDLALYGYL